MRTVRGKRHHALALWLALSTGACAAVGSPAVPSPAPQPSTPGFSGAPPSTSSGSATPDTADPPPAAAPTTAPATTTNPVTTTTPHQACLSRAVFGDPAESPYRLPFPAGEGYAVLQSYCVDDGSHETQLAYDFFMPIGSPVVAARSGVVLEVVEEIADEAHTSRFNYLLVGHEDGTVAFYAHLRRDGALVAVGEAVAAGDEIAVSGASGRTHESGVLHFGVYRSYPPREGRDLPVNFSNADGPLDERGGLRTGSFYRALP